MIRCEFFGMPGSGKTFVRNELIRSLKKINDEKFLTIDEALHIISKKKMDILFRLIINFIPNKYGIEVSKKLINRSLMYFNAQNSFISHYRKSLCTFLLSPQFEELSPLDRIDNIATFIQAGSMFECINNGFENETVILFDEGFLQKSLMFVSLSTNMDDYKKSVHNYFSNIPMPDILICIKADLDTCKERMLKRPKGYTKRLDRLANERDIIKSLEKYKIHVENTIDYLRANKGVDIIEVSNDQNDNIDRVLTDIMKRLRVSN